ncbi:hypothetical protein HYR65_02400, partial [Candidatus Azambacteria bacterium]|nr:hypothetical protein [Candidatus Azambacteria bacterium]
MNKLEDFEKKLYKRGEEAKKQKGYEVYKEEDAKIVKEGWDEETLKASASRTATRNLKIPFLLLCVAGAVTWGYFLYFSAEPFRTKDVQGGITGSERIGAGEEISFSVTYRNNTKASLRDAQILFTWPEGTLSSDAGVVLEGGRKMKADIGTVLPSQEKSATFRGRVFGSRDSVKSVESVFRYVPEGFSSPFEDKKTFSFTIVSTPFALNLNVPAQVVSEKDLDIALEYVNQSDAEFSYITLKATYPSGFHFVSAVPAPSGSENNVWELNAVKGRESGTIAIKGSFSGVQGESKSLFFEIGAPDAGEEFVQYASASSDVAIASSALFVFQTVNDSRDFSANPGAALQYKIRYKNTTNVQIPNVVIIAKIDETYIDVRTLNVQWGSFDGRTNSVIWNAVGVHDLSILDPKEEGQVSFSVNLKPAFLPKNFSDKNLTVASVVKITSSIPPEGLSGLPIESEDKLEVKINTQFSFNEKAYWRDGLLQNTGPLPPKVGERTTFAVSWQLSNTVNDVGDVEVSAVIPPNVEWTGAVYPEGAPITYDATSGVVTWKPGTVFAGTGLLTPAARVDFQVAFVPALV